MTQEDKDLLLKDLCARLPYGVVMTNIKLRETHYPLTTEDLHDAMFDDDWDDVPYLRPLSTMTDEEGNELVVEQTYASREDNMIAKFDWLNAHHFDFRNLIGLGLALEVPVDMYNSKKK